MGKPATVAEMEAAREDILKIAVDEGRDDLTDDEYGRFKELSKQLSAARRS